MFLGASAKGRVRDFGTLQVTWLSACLTGLSFGSAPRAFSLSPILLDLVRYADHLFLSTLHSTTVAAPSS